MSDPIERIRKFVTTQHDQSRFADARDAWSRKVTELLPGVEEMVAVMRESLSAGQLREPGVYVLVDPHRAQFPLVVAFGNRPAPIGDVLPFRAESVKMECGASVLFRCEPDGHVHGFRYPFHSMMKTRKPERFIDLGAPGHIQAVDLGHAMADFLEWATVGAGCGGHALQFGNAETLPFARPTQRLTIRAA
ncbi:MAG: hypothetical protein K2R98_34445 [Gemmataceae bacterium]|nr:hypothetical protein [Gemmataceae bacterium]